MWITRPLNISTPAAAAAAAVILNADCPRGVSPYSSNTQRGSPAHPPDVSHPAAALLKVNRPCVSTISKSTTWREKAGMLEFYCFQFV